MKTFRYLIVAVLFLLVAGTSGAQTRKEKKEALKTYVGEQVNGRTFKLEASMAYPMSGRSIPLTTPYGLQMKKDSVDVCLPYYGRAYQIPYGGGEGLRFRAPVENYSSKLKKDRYRITFEATPAKTTSGSRSTCTMTVRQIFMSPCATDSPFIIPDSSMQPGCNKR